MHKTVVAKCLRPDLIYDDFLVRPNMCHILLQLYHFCAGAKSNIISLNLADINLAFASANYFFCSLYLPERNKNCFVEEAQRDQTVVLYMQDYRMLKW